MSRIFLSVLLAAVALFSSVAPAAAGQKRDEVRDTLLRAATASESFYAESGFYSEELSDLRDHGLEIPGHVHLLISWGDKRGFCLQAERDALRGIWYYDWRDSFNNRRSVTRTWCPSTKRARRNWREQVTDTLINAATAEESYLVGHDRYTKDEGALRDEGWRKSNDQVYFRIAEVQGAARYCLQASHRRLGSFWHYDSDRGRTERGRCE